ncbi:MAG: preprotein translocase subunit SecE [Ignavibacteria bacterium]|nr:preprotein translocase subunit SecE [Ignavibacteria bacterium]
MKDKIITFFNDVLKEMRKVTWPTRDELRESTMVVLATTVVFSAFVFVVDWLMTTALNLLLAA